MKFFAKFGMLISILMLGCQASALTWELESLAGQGGFSPFAVQSDGAASGGQFIVWPNNGANQYLNSASDDATGQVQIVFTLSQTANVTFQIRASLANA